MATRKRRQTLPTPAVAQQDYLAEIEKVADIRLKLALERLDNFKIVEAQYYNDTSPSGQDMIKEARRSMNESLRASGYSDREILDLLQKVPQDYQHWDELRGYGSTRRRLDRLQKKYDDAVKDLQNAEDTYHDTLKGSGLTEEAIQKRIKNERRTHERQWNTDVRPERYEEYAPDENRDALAMECGAPCSSIKDHLCLRHTFNPECYQHIG